LEIALLGFETALVFRAVLVEAACAVFAPQLLDLGDILLDL
jgi:hypothetical protein